MGSRSNTTLITICPDAPNSPRNISSKSLPNSLRILFLYTLVSLSSPKHSSFSAPFSSLSPPSAFASLAGPLYFHSQNSSTSSSANVLRRAAIQSQMNSHTATRPCSSGPASVGLSGSPSRQVSPARTATLSEQPSLSLSC